MEANSFRNFQVIIVLLMKRVKEKCSNMRWNIPTKKTLEITKKITTIASRTNESVLEVKLWSICTTILILLRANEFTLFQAFPCVSHGF